MSLKNSHFCQVYLDERSQGDVIAPLMISSFYISLIKLAALLVHAAIKHFIVL